MMRSVKKSIGLALIAAGIVFAQNSVRWQNLYPAYSGLAVDGGKFVAVSLDGLIRTTADGETWSQTFVRDGGDTRSISAAAYGGGRFMAMQNNLQCLLSGDGSGWESASTGLAFTVKHMAFGDGKFVGVGDENSDGATFVYDQSKPGEGWDEQYAPAPMILTHVAFGAGGFVAVGSGVARLNDNGNWVSTSVSMSAQVGVVAFGADKFVALSKNGSNVYVSSDRTSWTTETASGAEADMTDMVFANGKFVAVGKAGKGCWSSNGTSWTKFTLNQNDNFVAVKYGNNIFLALGAKGSVYKSADGSSWTQLYGNSAASYKQIVYANNKYVAVGDSGVSVSSDGIKWESKTSAKNLTGVAFGAGKFAAVSDNGTITYSADGNTWTDYNAGDAVFTSIAFGGATFVAGGRTSGAERQSKVVVYTSADGEAWRGYEANDLSGWAAQGEYIASLCFGGDKFLAAVGGVATAELALRVCVTGGASVGRYWGEVQNLPNSADGYKMVSAVYADNKFVVTGNKLPNGESIVLNSADAASWTAFPTDAKNLRSATFANIGSVSANVAVADFGDVYAYLNNSWIQQGKATNRNLSAIYSGNGVMIAAGANGAMLYSNSPPTSIRNASAPRSAKTFNGGAMSLNRAGRTSTVTLSFTPDKAGAITVYSLNGRRLYKTRLGAGERSVRLPERVMSNGSVIVRYSGEGRNVSQRFQIVR